MVAAAIRAGLGKAVGNLWPFPGFYFHSKFLMKSVFPVMFISYLASQGILCAMNKLLLYFLELLT